MYLLIKLSTSLIKEYTIKNSWWGIGGESFPIVEDICTTRSFRLSQEKTKSAHWTPTAACKLHVMGDLHLQGYIAVKSRTQYPNTDRFKFDQVWEQHIL